MVIVKQETTTQTNTTTTMKLQDNNTTIERIGNVTNEAQFKMRSSQKAFQILSDLYSDKPLAIVRELGCNASDSMSAANKADQPFHIHLPNSLEPWLIIQDFGTGISHEDIYNIYTIYFASTKTNSNSQIGCLGLGSKSPFCYSDNFSVTSIYGGTKRIYNAFFGEDGTPTIALVSTQDTNENNGVAVQIPVKNTDFDNFKQAAYKAFRFFDVKPTISGGSVEWNDQKPIFFGDDWSFFDKSNQDESFAIMGGVTYPINSYQINNDGENDYRRMLRNGLVLKFAMGELDFTPSRDALSYTPSTILALHDKLKKVTEELPIKVNDLISNKDTLLEAIRATLFFKEKFSFLSINRGGISQSQTTAKLTWNGLDLTEPVSFFKKLAPNLSYVSKRAYSRRGYNYSSMPSFGNDVEWFVDDLTRGTDRRVRAYVKDSGKGVMFFDTDDYNSLLNAGFPSNLFRNTSSLPSPTIHRKIRSNGVVIQKAKEDVTIYNIGAIDRERWDSEVLEPADEIPMYYIVKEKDGWSTRLKLKGISRITNKNDLKNLCNAFDIKLSDVCMVSSREEKKLIDRGGISLIEHWDNNIDVDIDIEEYSIAVTGVSYYFMELPQNDLFKKIPNENKIKSTILNIIEMRKKYSKYIDIAYMITAYKGQTKNYEDFTPAQKIVFDNLVSGGYDTKDWLILAEAIG